jgi:hypothetical protein
MGMLRTTAGPNSKGERRPSNGCRKSAVMGESKRRDLETRFAILAPEVCWAR